MHLMSIPATSDSCWTIGIAADFCKKTFLHVLSQNRHVSTNAPNGG